MKSNQLEPQVLALASGTIGRVKPLSPPSKIRSLLKTRRKLIRDVDFICNYLGIRDWTLNLDWSQKAEFNAAEEKDWNRLEQWCRIGRPT